MSSLVGLVMTWTDMSSLVGLGRASSATVAYAEQRYESITLYEDY